MLDARIVKRRRGLVVDVALRVESGDAVAVFGPSGAGKSTVLACIAGFEDPDDGHVRLGTRTLFPPPAPLGVRDVGYLTQDGALFPHLSVGANVRFGVARGADEGWLAELRGRLGLEALWEAPAARISGGQARRVALARALARKPSVVLLDEAFAGLDRSVVRELVEDLARWRSERRFTLIVVDHQSEILERLAPRVVVLEAGRVVQSGEWHAVRAAPATPMIRSLIAPL